MGSAVILGTLSAPARLAEVVGAVILVVALYAVCLALERRGRRVELLTVIVGLIALESILWDQNDVPVGLFHPKFGGQNFRLYDVLLPVALLARLRVSGFPKRISPLGGAVAVFCGWYASEAVIGVMRNYGFNNVLYDAKLVIYVGGGYVLASGVSAEDILGNRGIRRLARPFAIITVFLIVLSGHHGINLPIPTLKVSGLAGVQPDAATFLFGLGVITLLVELASTPRRPTFILAGLVLMLSAVGSHQRAALAALAAGAAFAALTWLVPARGLPRIRLTPTETIGTTAVLVGGAITYPLLRGRAPWHLGTLPLGSLLSSTFGSNQKQQSALDRVAQFHAAVPAIKHDPILGWGLAKTVTYIATGTKAVVVTPSPDDVYLSIVLRTGFLGLALFAAVVVSALILIVRVWRNHPTPVVAALAWACGAILVAILARGAFEGVFEKYRLAIELGLALGMAASAARSLGRPPDENSPTARQPVSDEGKLWRDRQLL